MKENAEVEENGRHFVPFDNNPVPLQIMVWRQTIDKPLT